MDAGDGYETDDKVVATLELPGIDPADVEVVVSDSTLTVTGKREFSSEAKEENYRRIERHYGTFTRAVTLPQTADPERIEATFDRGVLTIEVAKAEKARPRKVQVKTR